MTDAATYGYQPGARPAGGQPRTHPNHLRVVSQDQSELPTSATSEDSQPVPADRVSAGQAQPAEVSDTASSDSRFRVSALWAATRDYWTPPKIFTDQPASLADLAAYAKTGPWTHQKTGPARALGVGYYRTVGYPYTVVSRYREYIAQRPGRLLVALGGIKLAASTGPGIWVVDHLIYPAAQLVGHILL